MAEFVDTTIKEIDTRLSELQEELERLTAARAALSGRRANVGQARRGRSAERTNGSGSASDGRKRGPGRPRGSRRGGNTRAKEALNLVRSKPGVTIPEIASELKILPNYLYRVMPKLIEDGQIRKDGQGFHPVG